MPHMDGMAAVRAIKEIKPDIPVVIASGSKHDEEEMRRAGLEDAKNLGKPYSLDQLLIAVAMALKH
jgi:CheY-like chemotaxis protein